MSKAVKPSRDAVEVGALSDWLVSHLKVTRAEALEQALAMTSEPAHSESEVTERVVAQPEQPEQPEPVEEAPPEASVEPGMSVEAGMSVEPEASDAPEAPEAERETSDGPTTLEPQVTELAEDDLDEAYASLALLRPEERRRRAARRKRLAIVALAAVALAAGFIVLTPRSLPPADVASLAPEIATPAAVPPPAVPVEPSKVVVLETHVIEVPVESKPSTAAPYAGPSRELETSGGVDDSAALRAIRSGRAVARYPDLPHATLLELEKESTRSDDVPGGRK